MGTGARSRAKQSGKAHTPALEWLFGAVGFALFASALGVTLVNASASHNPPDISVEAGVPAAAHRGFRVPFSAVNSGDATAADIQLIGRLMSGSEVVEEVEARIDLLPGNSAQEGGLIFARNPDGLVIDIRAVSYQDP